MADNYLERKMEEYKATVSSKKAMHRPVYGVRPGTVVLPYPSKRIMVIGAESWIGETVVRSFRKADCRVVFCSKQTKYGARLAQDSGAQFYPCDDYSCESLLGILNRIVISSGNIDVVICCVNMCSEDVARMTCYSQEFIIVSSEQDVGRNQYGTMDDININTVIVHHADYPELELRQALSNLCLCLTMPGGRAINGQCIHIGCQMQMKK